MAYLKGVLGTVAAIFLAVLVPMFWTTFRAISSEKATGLSVFTAGFLGSMLSPWFWAIPLLFSIFFYFSSHFQNKALRIAFFWVPTIAGAFGGFALWALVAILGVRFSRG